MSDRADKLKRAEPSDDEAIENFIRAIFEAAVIRHMETQVMNIHRLDDEMIDPKISRSLWDAMNDDGSPDCVIAGEVPGE